MLKKGKNYNIWAKHKIPVKLKKSSAEPAFKVNCTDYTNDI